MYREYKIDGIEFCFDGGIWSVSSLNGLTEPRVGEVSFRVGEDGCAYHPMSCGHLGGDRISVEPDGPIKGHGSLDSERSYLLAGEGAVPSRVLEHVASLSGLELPTYDGACHSIR